MATEILRNTQALLQCSFYLDETLTNASDTVTATVYRENGDTLVAANATNATTGVYTYTLAPQSNLDYLEVYWTGTVGGVSQTLVTEAEIVDSHYASVAEIRALDSLSSTSKYPLATVQAAMRETEKLFERICNRAFVPRYAREVFDGNGSDTLYLRHRDCRSLIAVEEDGSTLSTSSWSLYPDGQLYRDSGAFSTTSRRNVEVRYEHGLKHVPDDVKRAFLTYVRYLLLEAYNRLPDKTVSVSADGIFTQLAVAGGNRPTGLPEVDAVLNRWRAPRTSWVGGISNG